MLIIIDYLMCLLKKVKNVPTSPPPAPPRPILRVRLLEMRLTSNCPGSKWWPRRLCCSTWTMLPAANDDRRRTLAANKPQRLSDDADADEHDDDDDDADADDGADGT